MITTEENEIASGGSEHYNTKDDLTKSFEVVLKDLPEVLHYIKRLNEHIRRQQTTIVKLFEKLKELNAKSNHAVNVGTQTEDSSYYYWNGSMYDTSQVSAWSAGASESLADEVKQAAESAMRQTGFVYEASSGLYYDYNTGYYYNAELGLYYDGTSGAYIYYNEESNQFEYHSQASFPVQEAPAASSDPNSQNTPINPLEAPPPPPPPPPISPSTSTHSQDGKRSAEEDTSERKKRRVASPMEGQESPEDGEITDSSDSNDAWDSGQKGVEANLHEEDNEEDEDVSEKDRDSPPPTPPGETSSRFPNNPLSELVTAWPPCIRVIVQKSGLANLRVGALFIVTCTGGTLGRETGHAVCIPDINISKHHAKFTFASEDGKYYVTDLGSRNGTLLNGQRLSSAKQESEPHEVDHGSTLQLGSTTLLCHVHGGNETCPDCEPGLVGALNDTNHNGAEVVAPVSMETKGAQHKQELRRLRKKFGLTSAEAAAEVAGAACPPGYEDRAHTRRQTVGSQHHNVKTEMASVDQHIKPSNKGFKMLSKMGWVHGQALGKDGTAGASAEPITVAQRPDKAGLGVDLDTLPPEVDDRKKRKADVWRKVQQRYSELPSEDE